MSIVIVETPQWQRDEWDYCYELKTKIKNQLPIMYKYFDFETCETIYKNEKVRIESWLDTDNTTPEERERFAETQLLLINRICDYEYKKGINCSAVKRELFNQVDEYTHTLFDINGAIEELLENFTQEKIESFSDYDCVDYRALYFGMQDYDATAYDKSLRIWGRYSSAYAKGSEKASIAVFNEVKRNGSAKIAEDALHFSCISGIKNRIITDPRDSGDINADFMIQLTYCEKALIELLGRIEDGAQFKRQFLECMKAMYCFGTIENRWYNRYIRF